ncbi:MAG: phage tail protein [Anaerolineales bacterium]|nr:phage tail protein [Anaerolineales bacterium]MCB9128393.1 phage tail protein [Ardenticatenales bacterium]
MSKRANEPITSPRYIVDFPKLQGVFSEVSVASAEFEVINYKFADGKGNTGNYAQPGNFKPPEMTLKRGVTEDFSAWDWAKEVQDGNMTSARSNGTIHLCDYDGTPLLSYEVIGAWPKKLTMPGPKAGGNEVLVEEITLVMESFNRQQ